MFLANEFLRLISCRSFRFEISPFYLGFYMQSCQRVKCQMKGWSYILFKHSHIFFFSFFFSSGLSNGPSANLLTIPKQRSSSVTLTYHAGPRRAGEALKDTFPPVSDIYCFPRNFSASLILSRHISLPESSHLSKPQPSCHRSRLLIVSRHEVACGVPRHGRLFDETKCQSEPPQKSGLHLQLAWFSADVPKLFTPSLHQVRPAAQKMPPRHLSFFCVRSKNLWS